MIVMIDGGICQVWWSREVMDDKWLRKDSRTLNPIPPQKKILPPITEAYSQLIDPIPLEQFGAFVGAGQLTKEQEVISTERAQNVILAKNTSRNAWR